MKPSIFSKEFWVERDVELYIGKLLRYGVMLACGITLLGGIIYLIQHHGIVPDYKTVPSGETFAGVDQSLREFSSIWKGVLAIDGASIIQLGVIVLIATPIMRVAFSAVAFLIEKDYMYVVITLIVLFIILANVIFGLH
ncbi:DUF1634 domain-containing protein [Dysgonomonas sp. 520]|nr:DUF1634 domain-containing protein [Dysgonomonas sp. 520]